ncbi:MAG TPA: hypothetical protein PK082_01870 [Phycisphaerae bacterium]|nr:hypothetical protein [Phycisphaerae bacterium]
MLWAAVAALSAAFFAVVLWLLWPVRPSRGKHPEGGSGVSDFHPTKLAVRPIENYACIHERDLHKPLFDPKPAAAVVAPQPKPKLTVRLTGTATDPDFTCGFFRTQSGETKMVGVNQTIEGAKVLEVLDKQVKVEFHGDILTLKVEEDR